MTELSGVEALIGEVEAPAKAEAGVVYRAIKPAFTYYHTETLAITTYHR